MYCSVVNAHVRLYCVPNRLPKSIAIYRYLARKNRYSEILKRVLQRIKHETSLKTGWYLDLVDHMPSTHKLLKQYCTLSENLIYSRND